jgi:DNA-binding NarL/FixJ family response regulator
MAGQANGFEPRAEKHLGAAQLSEHPVAPENHVRIALVAADSRSRVALRDALAARADHWTLDFYPSVDHISVARYHPTRAPHVALVCLGPRTVPVSVLIGALKLLWPSVRLVLLLKPAQAVLAYSLVVAGADGCLVTPLVRHDLVGMIGMAAQGLPALCHDAQTAIIAEARRRSTASTPAVPDDPESPGAVASVCGLAAREERILGCLEEGLLYKEISGRLGLSYSLLRKLQHRIFIRLNAANRTEAVKRWHRLDT